jgi:hypothetical protein
MVRKAVDTRSKHLLSEFSTLHPLRKGVLLNLIYVPFPEITPVLGIGERKLFAKIIVFGHLRFLSVELNVLFQVTHVC